MSDIDKIIARLRYHSIDGAMGDVYATCEAAADALEKYQRALSWIEDQDPQVVDTARERFSIG